MTTAALNPPSAAQQLVDRVKNMPLVSQAALRLVNLLDQPEADNDEIVNAIKCDNILTAKLLRACNSPYFGLEEPVESVDQAVMILGHQQILHIVLTLAFSSAMVVPLPGYAVEASELWRHSLITASAAEIIAVEANGISLEKPVAFTVGLLHDIGKLVMSQALTPDVQATIRQLIEKEKISRSEAEKTVLGTDHGEVGACLLKGWHLPEKIIEAAANHHNPVFEPAPQLSVVTHLANCLAHLAGSAPGWDGFAVRVNPQAIVALEIREDRLENMVVEVRASFDKVDQFMSMS
ncbi:MAG TPA: HDOD domain-containing protein [Verrucomicrobiae bacterium]|nr:HDOD domain-containing protein [Verrucomicrobiae bacterium]